MHLFGIAFSLLLLAIPIELIHFYLKGSLSPAVGLYFVSIFCFLIAILIDLIERLVRRDAELH